MEGNDCLLSWLESRTYGGNPEAAIDCASFNAMADRTKMTGEWLAYCSACSVPEIANLFNRAGIKFHQIARWSRVLEGSNLVGAGS